MSTPPMPIAATNEPIEAQPSGNDTPKSTTSDDDKYVPEDFVPGTRFYLAFVALSVLTLMVALDGTTISVALPIITRKLHGSAIEAFWSGTSFLLTSAVIQPLLASFSNIFGRRPMIFTSLAFFLAGSLIAALSNNFTILIVGRSLQGIGGGGVMALTEIVVTDLVPLRLRGQWFGIISAMWSIGSVSGPVIGGAFAENVSWRWIFYLNLPFIGVGTPLVYLFLKMNFPVSSLVAKLRRVDWIGIFLFVASATSFLIPLTWGGVMYSWSSWHTLVPLLVGLAGIAAFILYEIYFAKEQLIRLSIFSTTTSRIAYLTDTLHGFILWCVLYYLPIYYQATHGYSPIISGVAIFPGTFTVAPMAVVTGITITKTGHYRTFILIGWALACLGTGLMILLDVSTSVPAWIFLTLIMGFGMGILFPSLQFAVQGASTNKDLAFAVAMFAFFRTLGNAIGVAIGGVVFQNSIHQKLLKYPYFAPNAAQLAKDATGLVQIIKNMQDGQNKHDLKQAFADGIRPVWILLCALAGVALVISWWIKSYDLNRALETEQGFKHQKRESKDIEVEKGEAEP